MSTPLSHCALIPRTASRRLKLPRPSSDTWSARASACSSLSARTAAMKWRVLSCRAAVTSRSTPSGCLFECSAVVSKRRLAVKTTPLFGATPVMPVLQLGCACTPTPRHMAVFHTSSHTATQPALFSKTSLHGSTAPAPPPPSTVFTPSSCLDRGL
jgi:hypothetical protein